MAFTNLSIANGWIPVQYSTNPLMLDSQTSAVEAVARVENMTSEQVKVPRFRANGIDVVAEGALIPVKDATADSVILDAFKFADRFAVSSEDSEDAIVDAFAAFEASWLSNYAVALDNACLGVTGAGGPFESVYRAVGAGRRLATAGVLTYEDLVDVIGDMETNRKGGLVVIAHPGFAMQLRNLKDATGARVVDTTGVLGAGVPTVFGNEIRFSYGARTSLAFSDSPTGNPLLVVANRQELILGKRTGPEKKISTEAQWENDNLELKMRARRAFALADATSARVVELTAAV